MLANLSQQATAHPLTKDEKTKMQNVAEELAITLGKRFSRMANKMTKSSSQLSKT